MGLGLAGHVIQVYSIFYILPSAEVEYCILDDEKNWVSNITLIGIGCGALLWGALAGKNGRRRALLSCLAVSGVFSGKNCRFDCCSTIWNFHDSLYLRSDCCIYAHLRAVYDVEILCCNWNWWCLPIGRMVNSFICIVNLTLGSSFLPSFHSYLCEITPLSGRARIIAFLNTIGISGGIFAGAVAISVIPLSGQSIVIENKEHFSAWHRYLLLMTIIPIISTILLCWLPESPRYLLANGDEVEALATYQVRDFLRSMN